MNTPAPRSDDVRRARRAFLLVGFVAPIVIAAIALTLILIWLPELPEQVVTHWGSDGPDGFGSRDTYVWMQVFVGFGIPLLTLPVLAMTPDSWGPIARLVGAISLGTAVLIAVGMAGSVLIQRGSADGSGLGAVLAIGFAAMLVFGVVGWFAQPRVTSVPRHGRAARLTLASGERAAWFGTTAMGRPGVILLTVAVLALIVVTVGVALADSDAWWIMAAVTILLIALIATTLVFRVRASADGLRVRSVTGWPRWNIPAADITGARAVQVNPMGEFGGWGLRFAVDGRMGVVLRTGEALQVTRRSGRTLVVTIDDARTAAAVLTAAGTSASTSTSATASDDREDS